MSAILRRHTFNVLVCCLSFSGIHNLQSRKILFRTLPAFDTIGIKDQDHLAAECPLIIRHNVDQLIPRAVDIDRCQSFQFLPGIDDIVPVHDQQFFLARYRLIGILCRIVCRDILILSFPDALTLLMLRPDIGIAVGIKRTV